MRHGKSLAVVLAIVCGSSAAANAGHCWHSFFVFKDTCHSCQHCPNVCHSFGCQWCWNIACLDSTCDMIPHYAYYPECHGSYYFRPYNWEQYCQDTAFMLGLGQAAPYSEDGFHELKPVAVPQQPIVRVRHQKLPNLEALMRKTAVPPEPPKPGE